MPVGVSNMVVGIGRRDDLAMSSNAARSKRREKEQSAAGEHVME